MLKSWNSIELTGIKHWSVSIFLCLDEEISCWGRRILHVICLWQVPAWCRSTVSVNWLGALNCMLRGSCLVQGHIKTCLIVLLKQGRLLGCSWYFCHLSPCCYSALQSRRIASASFVLLVWCCDLDVKQLHLDGWLRFTQVILTVGPLMSSEVKPAVFVSLLLNMTSDLNWIPSKSVNTEVTKYTWDNIYQMYFWDQFQFWMQ